ncbi:MAG: cupin domain-containing protein [Chloroflexi bacterium]|nr:MAG: cupin domain-containing protein [Chloroflexota bacterium]
MRFETKQLPVNQDYAAPDGSEIRLLLEVSRGGVCHCTLASGRTSRAVAHRTVDEVWYFLQGRGQVWRSLGDHEREVDVCPGTCLTVPVGTHFQVRNTGSEPLFFIIATMPPWPGPAEAVAVEAHWAVS